MNINIGNWNVGTTYSRDRKYLTNTVTNVTLQFRHVGYQRDATKSVRTKTTSDSRDVAVLMTHSQYCPLPHPHRVLLSCYQDKPRKHKKDGGHTGKRLSQLSKKKKKNKTIGILGYAQTNENDDDAEDQGYNK